MKKIISALILLVSIAAHAESFDCYLKAVGSSDAGLSPGTAVSVCEGMKADTTPHDCYAQSFKIIGPSVAVKICAKSTSAAGPMSCFQQLQNSIGPSVSAILCRGSNGSDIESRLNCWNQAQKVGSAGTAPGYTVDPGLSAKLCSQ